ncbi:MAG: right-handed parallel beta-helix repeat-containing protein, partial [Gammaproteobacteria bacterium]|nr:right-handed parallel beta-helix repeat-containing protein [Gammaproteobacteria bacterium]
WKGAGSTVIDASGFTNVGTVYMHSGTLDGFTITGGSGTKISNWSYGGGIWAIGDNGRAAPIIIKNNVIAENETCLNFVKVYWYQQCFGFGSGVMIHNTDNATVENNLIVNNTNGKSAVYISGANSAKILRNIISNNPGDTGITLERARDLTVDSTFFTKLDKTAILVQANSWGTTITNSAFIGNRVAEIIINYYDESLKLYNSTIAYNQKGNGYVLKLLSGSIIENSIIWDNARTIYNETYNLNGFAVSDGAQIINSIVEYGYTPESSINVIDADPQFVNPEAGDFRLASTSPALDSGSDLTSVGITTDITGGSRPLDGNANGVAEFDMGAFEQ